MSDDWLPPERQPRRAGVYPVRLKAGNGWLRGYSHWDGKTWSWFCQTAETAAKRGTEPDRQASHQRKWWLDELVKEPTS